MWDYRGTLKYLRERCTLRVQGKAAREKNMGQAIVPQLWGGFDPGTFWLSWRMQKQLGTGIVWMECVYGCSPHGWAWSEVCAQFHLSGSQRALCTARHQTMLRVIPIVFHCRVHLRRWDCESASVADQSWALACVLETQGNQNCSRLCGW